MYEESYITDPVVRLRHGEMDFITRVEADKLYKKIIGEVYNEIKKYGFKKKSSVNFVRVDNQMYQKLNFQRYTHLPSMTINIAFRPFFLNYTEEYVLSSNKRLGNFESDLDKWYGIRRDYKEAAKEILDIIVNHVLPYYDSLNSSKKVLDNIAELEKSSNSYDNLILFCALKENNVDVCVKYLSKQISSSIKQKKELEVHNLSLEDTVSLISYYENLYQLVLGSGGCQASCRLAFNMYS